MISPEEHQEIAEEVSATVSEAISGVLAKHGGGMLTGFVVLANYVDTDGHGNYAEGYMENQDLWTSLGLSQWQHLSLEAEARGHFEGS